MEAKGLEKKKLRSEILNYALEASEFGRLFNYVLKEFQIKHVG